LVVCRKAEAGIGPSPAVFRFTSPKLIVLAEAYQPDITNRWHDPKFEPLLGNVEVYSLASLISRSAGKPADRPLIDVWHSPRMKYDHSSQGNGLPCPDACRVTLLAQPSDFWPQ
jgi:hypothetical protein